MIATRNAHASSGKSFGLREAASAFFRHKRKASIFALSVLGLAALVILFAPRKYRSEARMVLQVGRESVRLDPTATTGSTIALQQSGRDNEIATAVEVLKSREILDKAVDKLTPEVVLGESGPGKVESGWIVSTLKLPLRAIGGLLKQIDPISKHEEAVILMQRNFGVDAEHDSTLIVCNYDARSPQLAQTVMQAIVQAFQEAHVRMHQTTGSKPFFTAQSGDLEKQLVVAETKLRDAKNDMGLASIELRRETLEKRLGEIELNRNSTVQAIAAAEAKIAALKTHADAIPETLHSSTRVVPNTGADALRTKLYELQVQLMNLEAKYNGDHPLVQATRAQVEEAKRMVDGQSTSRQETEDSLNENHQSLALDQAQSESELSGLNAQLAELDSQRTAVQGDLKQINNNEVALDELDRAVQLARTNFFLYADRMEQARVDEELDRSHISNISVAQEASFAEKPVSPSKPIVAALGLLLAAAGATAIVLAGEKLDARLNSEDQIEELLRLPVLAVVPEGRQYGAAPIAVG